MVIDKHAAIELDLHASQTSPLIHISLGESPSLVHILHVYYFIILFYFITFSAISFLESAAKLM